MFLGCFPIINDAESTPFAAPGDFPANLANSAATLDDFSGVRCLQEVVLKHSQFIFSQVVWQMAALL